MRYHLLHHLATEGAVFEACRYSKDTVEGAWVFEKRGQARHHLQALKPLLEVDIHGASRFVLEIGRPEGACQHPLGLYSARRSRARVDSFQTCLLLPYPEWGMAAA